MAHIQERVSLLLSAHWFCHSHCFSSQSKSPCTTSLSTNHTFISFASRAVFIDFPCSLGRQILFERLSRWKTTTLEHSRQKGGTVEWGGWTNAPHYCCQLLSKREVRCHWHLRWPLHLLWHRGIQLCSSILFRYVFMWPYVIYFTKFNFSPSAAEISYSNSCEVHQRKEQSWTENYRDWTSAWRE